MLVKHFIDEYARYRTLGAKALAQAPDDALARVPAPESNSIATIVRHVSGNLLSRFTDFLTSDGEKPWRDRDVEFEERPATRAELVELWNRAFTVALDQLSALGDDDLARTVRIRGAELTVHEALCRSLAHTAMHTGQVVLLAKMFAGSAWRTLSIPRGQSAAYNANPRGEHAATHARELEERK